MPKLGGVRRERGGARWARWKASGFKIPGQGGKAKAKGLGGKAKAAVLLGLAPSKITFVDVVIGVFVCCFGFLFDPLVPFSRRPRRTREH